MDKGSDPNQLTGDERREEGTLKPIGFFWDSSVLDLSYLIMTLSVVTKFIELSDLSHRSSVACNVDDSDNVSSDYINNFCAESLPITKYLLTFIFIHGLAIAIPHYLWIAYFGRRFDSFLSVVSTMDRSRDDTTRQYSQKNFNIVRQLQLSFTKYGRNFVYYLYIGKLMLQMIFAVASLVVSVVYFTDFNVIFQCPRDNSTINNDPNWPLNNDVTCKFTALELLFWIRIVDIILICLVVLVLVWNFNGERKILALHKKYIEDIPLDEIDVQWTFDLNNGNPFSLRSFTPVDYSHMITVPRKVTNEERAKAALVEVH